MNKIKKFLKIVFDFIEPFKREFWLVFLMAVLASLAGALIPLIYGKLVDLIRDPNLNLRLVILLLLGWISLTLLIDWARRAQSLRGSILAFKASRGFVIFALGHVMRLPLSYLRETKVGQIGNKIDRFASSMDMFIDRIVFNWLPELLSLLFAVIVIILLEWRLSLFMIAGIILFVLATYWKNEIIISARKKYFKKIEHAYGELWEFLSSVDMVKSFAQEEKTEGILKKEFFKESLPGLVVYMKRLKNLDFWQSNIRIFIFVGVFSLALYFVNQGVITIGKFVSLLGYLFIVVSPLTSLSWHFRNLKEAQAAWERIDGILKLETEFYNKNGKTLSNVNGDIVFEGVKFKYADSGEILKNIDLNVKAGETVAIVGESGVGKTTLVDLLPRFFIPFEGKILLDGHNIQDMNLVWLRSQIAVVPQDIILFHDTIEKNLLYGNPAASKKDLIKAVKAANIYDFIISLDKKFKKKVGEKGFKLSTGQRQRLAIARAFLKNAAIVILDEPTASLDAQSEKLIQDSLERLTGKRTTFIIAHRFSTIAKADKIAVLKQGVIAEIGSHQELLANKNSEYRRLYSLQTI